MKAHLWLSVSFAALLAASCGSDPSKPDVSGPPEVHNPKVPAGSTIAFIDFRDCTIADQDDCSGSGVISSSIFMDQLGTSTVFHVSRLSRPVDAKAFLSDDAAVAYAKDKGFAYVMNGEITDYYKVTSGAGWWRKERAALTLRVLSVADGKILYTHTDSDTANNIRGTPNGMIKSMASDVQDDLEDN